MSWLALRPKKQGFGDGYSVFRSESDAFIKLHGGAIVEIDARKMKGTAPRADKAHAIAARCVATEAAIRAAGKIDGVALFCHGWKTGLQLGHSVATAKNLATAIADAVDSDAPMVALYACACGGGKNDERWRPGDEHETGDGGVADAVRDALCTIGVTHCRVDAHATVGHATGNPFVRRFYGDGSVTGGRGGAWLVNPDNGAAFGTWSRALKRTTMRLRFPTLSRNAIHEELRLGD